MDDTAVQMIFQPPVIATLLYVSSAWQLYGLATCTTANISKVLTLFSRGSTFTRRQPTASELVANADNKLCYSMLYDSIHVLYYLLPYKYNNST